MEKFLKEYVKDFAEVKGLKLLPSKIKKIVHKLMNEDEIWDTLDYYINEEIKEEK